MPKALWKYYLLWLCALNGFIYTHAFAVLKTLNRPSLVRWSIVNAQMYRKSHIARKATLPYSSVFVKLFSVDAASTHIKTLSKDFMFFYRRKLSSFGGQNMHMYINKCEFIKVWVSWKWKITTQGFPCQGAYFASLQATYPSDNHKLNCLQIYINIFGSEFMCVYDMPPHPFCIFVDVYVRCWQLLSNWRIRFVWYAFTHGCTIR